MDPPAVRQLGRQQPPSSRRAATLPLPSKEWDVAANRDRLLRRRHVVSLPVPPKVPTIDRQEPDIFQPSQSDDSSPPRRTPNATSNNAPKFASTNIDYREETPGRMVRDGSVPSVSRLPEKRYPLLLTFSAAHGDNSSEKAKRGTLSTMELQQSRFCS